MKVKAQRPWLCALRKGDEIWSWGGETMEEAINSGLDIWGGAVDGFWVAPAHPTTAAEEADGQEQDYTIETEKAEWIPLT